MGAYEGFITVGSASVAKQESRKRMAAAGLFDLLLQ